MKKTTTYLPPGPEIVHDDLVFTRPEDVEEKDGVSTMKNKCKGKLGGPEVVTELVPREGIIDHDYFEDDEMSYDSLFRKKNKESLTQSLPMDTIQQTPTSNSENISATSRNMENESDEEVNTRNIDVRARRLPVAALVHEDSKSLREQVGDGNIPIAISQLSHDIASKPKIQRSTKVKVIIFVILALIIIISVSIILPYSFAEKKDIQTEVSPTPMPTSYREGKINFHFTESLSVEKEIYTDSSTTYGKLYNWMLHDNVTWQNIDSGNDFAVLQRSIVGLIYFSLAETRWNYCPPYEDNTELINDQENEVSCTFYNSKEAFEEQRSRWLSSTDVCEWGGLDCMVSFTNEGIVANKITHMTFWDMNVSGTLPSEVGLLTELNVMRFQGNNPQNIRGTLPTEIGLLNRLSILEIDHNRFTGEVPHQLYHLTNLLKLYIGFNDFTGHISTKIGQLSKLQLFIAHHNRLSGSIPNEIGNLSDLEVLNLSRNFRLIGTLPSDVGRLTALRKLWLQNCTGLSGSLPSEIGHLRNLRELYLHQNSFSKNLPDTLYNLTNLEKLYMYENKFTGTISPLVGNLTSLKGLVLHNNELNGTVPIEIEKLKNLNYFYVHYNEISESIPVEICYKNIQISADCLEDSTTTTVATKCPDNCCYECCNNQEKICKTIFG